MTTTVTGGVAAAGNQADAVPTLLNCLKTASHTSDMTSTSMTVLQAFLGNDASKDAFARANGASQLKALLLSEPGNRTACTQPFSKCVCTPDLLDTAIMFALIQVVH